MAAIELVGVAARYGGEIVLRDVDLAVRRGTITAVLGANGSGKSTLLRVVSGTGPSVSGRVLLDGVDVVGRSRRELARQVALVPQRVEVPRGFRVREVVAMGRAPHLEGWLRLGPDDERAVAEALEACDLAGLADRTVDVLSGGQLQRVHLARVVAQAAPVLLLDEATAHLDVRHARASLELVRTLVRARRLACVAAMHDLAAAARVADRVALLREGRVYAEGPVADVMTPERLEATFGVPVAVVEGPDGQPVFGLL